MQVMHMTELLIRRVRLGFASIASHWTKLVVTDDQGWTLGSWP